jgi:dTDP-4-dehydrorhamnose 3,5-epimerase
MGTVIDTLRINGAKLLTSPVYTDSRGSFETFWEKADLSASSVSFNPTNSHHSYNIRAGTIRAFHFQRPPQEQAKLVSCVSGKTWDVILDLRPESPTFRQWEAVTLCAVSGHAIYIPRGCAHGFATLQDHTTVAYLIEGQYRPEAAAVVRWDDASLSITWPISHPILSDRDRNAPNLDVYLRSL